MGCYMAYIRTVCLPVKRSAQRLAVRKRSQAAALIVRKLIRNWNFVLTHALQVLGIAQDNALPQNPGDPLSLVIWILKSVLF